MAVDGSPQTVPVDVAAADAPQVDDPVLAARMGANGVYLETTPDRQQANRPAAQPPKRRNFFAALFSAPETEQPMVRRQPPQQPQAVAVAAEPPSEPTVGAEAGVTNEIVLESDESAAVDVAVQPEPTAFIENRPAEAAAAPAPRRRSFLSAFFSSSEPEPEPRAQPRRPVVQVASAAPASASAANIYGNDALPGVRDQDSLYDISRKSGSDDDSDIDINEGDDVQLAMAPGLARLAPNGLMIQTDRVDIACLKPSLVRVLKAVERHYGERVVVTSGYRSPQHNRRARGSRNSLHMYCAAADIQVEDVDKWELAQFLRSMPGRGGVGTYCHTKSVHVDVGPERDWNWRCRRRKRK